MATSILQTAAPSRMDAEESFFGGYQWCLNPMLSLRDLLQHLGEEIDSYGAGGDAGWQGEERRINIYLFACAIACTLDDHLAARRFPAGRTIARASGWRRQWTDCVDRACEMLLDGGESGFRERASRLMASAPGALDEGAQAQRMRIPEAFRCQDLTHQDVSAMVQGCLPALAEKDRPIAIVGPRTAGAYFAPLAAARLRALGYTRVTWNTVRPGVEERLPLYKILYAMNALRAAKYWLARKPNGDRREDWNRQFVGARSFAAFHVARYCGRKLDGMPAVWERRLCFLDLDGVLDGGWLGFPHTTPCGIHALQLLRRNRFGVVLNTARSVEHVREYCRAYRLPGGVAELGSVFWDAIREWEVPLIDGEAAVQLERLRAEMQNLPGVCLDPENRYSIRAYRFQDGNMRPLETAETEAVLGRAGCHRLTLVQSQADTYIIQRGAGKGPAVASVKAYLGCTGEPVAAIGDSAADVEMLRGADVAYAPANASREVRELIARGEYRKTARRLQAGLLEAAMELSFAAGHRPDDGPRDAAPCDAAPPTSLLDELLHVPDRHSVERIFSALQWRGL